MTEDQTNSSGGHLRYYQQQEISPVRYRVEDIDTHFDRRDSLYRSLGLPPIALSGARILEVAPGSGQNSLYVASCKPSTFDLVEPNPSGLRDIEAAYEAFDRPHTRPRVHSVRLEEFAAQSPFDIVLCENWLGSLPHEIRLIEKLASLVAPGGVLVLTIVPLSGFFPNVMRKLFSLRIADPRADFETRTAQLVDVFGPHLVTIKNMTRNHRDWVHDCMLNPHYLNVVLPFDTVLNTIGADLEVLATFPRFTLDWRWFKTLSGGSRAFNAHALAAYYANEHNFIDYRRTAPPRPEASRTLSNLFRRFYNAAVCWQTAFTNSVNMAAASTEISAILEDLVAELKSSDKDLVAPVAEAAAVWAENPLRPETVRDMTDFASLFGRETIYVSFTRSRTGQRS